MKTLAIVCVTVLACAVVAAEPLPAGWAIDVEPRPAVAGELLVVQASAEGELLPVDVDVDVVVDVVVETRPASQLAEVDTIGRLPAGGTLRFVPDRPGLVRLTLRDRADGRELARHDLAVHAPTVPIGAVIVLIVAGALLFGGVRVGLSRMDDDPGGPRSTPGSTDATPPPDDSRRMPR